MLPSTPPWTSSAPRTTCSAATASPPASRNGGGLRPLRAVTVQDPDRLRWLLAPALSELLDVVVTRQDAPPKPAPDGLHLALSRLNTKPERAVFVGDSPTDMTAARAGGVLALGAVWGWHPPTALRAAGASHLRHPPSTTATAPSKPHLGRSAPELGESGPAGRRTPTVMVDQPASPPEPAANAPGALRKPALVPLTPTADGATVGSGSALRLSWDCRPRQRA
ncbi:MULTISPECIES: HAD family hydrolase [unclassified Streptomyces]|uniref:HAD family hydrolase n=1 Tax=unclassified Streptomyces TaxID=2593676 RepID=UPI0037F8CF07